MNCTPVERRTGPRRPALLLCSAGLNLLLLAGVGGLVAHRLAPPSPLPARLVRAAANTGAQPASAPASGDPEPVQPLTNQWAFRWAQLESTDFRVFIANLRSVRCPEPIIRDLVFFDLERLYQNRQDARPGLDLFWQPARARDRADDDDERRKDALELERRAVMRELLGAWWTKEAWDLWYDGELAVIPELLVGYLRNGQVLEAISVYQDMQRHSDTGCELCSPAEERARKEAAYRRTSAAFASIMSPSEFEEMSLRICVAEGKFENFSRADFHFRDGVELREFAKLFNRQQPFFSREFLSGTEDDEAGAVEFQARLKGLLGPDRYAVWDRAQDSGYQDIWSFGQQQSLSQDTIFKAWQVRQAAEEEFGRLSGRSDLSPAERSACWAEVRQQTETALASLLGNVAGREYLKTRAGWLQRQPTTGEQP